MKSFRVVGRFLSACLPAALLLVALPAFAAPEGEVRAELISEVSEVGAGEPFWLGLRMRMQENWHTYWQNPGDSGLPTTIEWKLPPGFQASEIHWPTPDRYMIGPLANFGYEEEVILLTKITPPDELEAGASLPIGLEAKWLSCEEECIPGRAEQEIVLKAAAGPGVFHSIGGPLIAKTLAALPGEANFESQFIAEGDSLTLLVRTLPYPAERLESAFFFPFLDTVVEHAAPQTVSVGEAGLSLRMTASPLNFAPLEKLEGVLVLREGGELERRHAYTLRATPLDGPALAAAGGAAAIAGGEAADSPAAVDAAAGPAAEVGTEAGAAQPAAAGGVAAGAAVVAAAAAAPSLGLFQVLLFALLGGLVLNLMPCVFPVLSLKVLGVVQQATEEPKRVRLHGIAYTAGILVSFALVAGVLIALRAGGAQIGWGFQLQSPIFIAILIYVLFAMGLSLSGVVEFGGSIMGVGSSLANRPGLSGSFFTGVLATVVATPCTAPFMGAAVGFALTQPAAIGLLVFLTLGLGLALPFLALSFVPSAHRLLPRPGPWMEKMKEALAFPLYATVAWLVWVLSLQAGSFGLAAVLGGLVLIGLAAWAYGSSRSAGRRMRWVGTSVAALAVVGSLVLAEMPETVAPTPAKRMLAAGDSAAAVGEPEPFSEERLNQLLTEGKPVFVNFTAAWCVTCLVNEQNALSTPAVRSSLAEKGVTYLKGDWTNEDPEITKVLERFGRSGVPLYLVYGSGSTEPTVLPQILTESTVIEHLRAL